MSKKKEHVQKTIADLNDLRLPETTRLEAEWTDAAGHHRAPVTGAWESENGSVVLTVGKDTPGAGKV